MRKESKILEAKPQKKKAAKMKKFNIVNKDGEVLNNKPIEALSPEDIVKMVVAVK